METVYETSGKGSRLRSIPTPFQRFQLHGVLDAAQVKPLLKHHAQSMTHLTLDLQQVTALDTAAIPALTRLVKRYHQHGLTLRLANVNPTVQTILELVRLDRLFSMEDSQARPYPYSA